MDLESKRQAVSKAKLLLKTNHGLRDGRTDTDLLCWLESQ